MGRLFSRAKMGSSAFSQVLAPLADYMFITYTIKEMEVAIVMTLSSQQTRIHSAGSRSIQGDVSAG